MGFPSAFVPAVQPSRLIRLNAVTERRGLALM